MRRRQGENHGFTLIELSIVLVIIGLIIGCVLVGQDLIGAANTRAQVAQIEKYNTAANTFKTKYNGLPGDIPATQAAQFGFTVSPRAGTQAQGDGNGVIEGIDDTSTINGVFQNGETVWFWTDLSDARMIDGTFNSASATPTTWGPSYYFGNSPPVSLILPQAKIGQNNYIYVYSSNGSSYFGLSTSTSNIDGDGALHGGIPALTVAQAYNIGKKIDDGFPQTGNVTAQYENWDYFDITPPSYNGIVWAGTTQALFQLASTIAMQEARQRRCNTLWKLTKALTSTAPSHSRCRARHGSGLSTIQHLRFTERPALTAGFSFS
jgi:prepilin-type N-terminal cleavage/methylation domain-containing protein